jgi:hypothetical protein
MMVVQRSVPAASKGVRAMTLPEGLTYVPGFLTETGERDVLAVLRSTPHS